MQRVLITGGAGSIGVELAGLFAENGYQVRVFDLPICDFSSLDGISGLETMKGDITNRGDLKKALNGVKTVVHLAAILPPDSEIDQKKTFSVNVDSTRNIVEGLKGSRSAHIVLASSVTTYGDTSRESPPVTTSNVQRPVDIYARSKVETEAIIRSSGHLYTILRISGISIPKFLEPPEIWPFTARQRIEFINRSDVVKAVYQSTVKPEARGTILNIAGGSSWQMRGEEYIRALYGIMGVPHEEARYRDTPGAFDWYDTRKSQLLLNYQETPLPVFLNLLEKAIEEMMGV